jgi:hypothetical protein
MLDELLDPETARCMVAEQRAGMREEDGKGDGDDGEKDFEMGDDDDEEGVDEYGQTAKGGKRKKAGMDGHDGSGSKGEQKGDSKKDDGDDGRDGKKRRIDVLEDSTKRMEDSALSALVAPLVVGSVSSSVMVGLRPEDVGMVVSGGLDSDALKGGLKDDGLAPAGGLKEAHHHMMGVVMKLCPQEFEDLKKIVMPLMDSESIRPLLLVFVLESACCADQIFEKNSLAVNLNWACHALNVYMHVFSAKVTHENSSTWPHHSF